MKQNVGRLDKIVRAGLGGAVLSLAFLGPQTAWGYLGLIGLLSAASGFCPAYALYRRYKPAPDISISAIEKDCWNRDARGNSQNSG